MHKGSPTVSGKQLEEDSELYCAFATLAVVFFLLDMVQSIDSIIIFLTIFCGF